MIDGDTVEAQFPNGAVDTLRLRGVDTPETTLSRVQPAEYEGIPDTTAGKDHLLNWGEKAAAFTRSALAGRTVRIEVDPDADRRGAFGRLLVYLYVDGEHFNKRLLSEGYARVYDASFSQRSEFDAIEARARKANVGLWNVSAGSSTPATADHDLVVSTIHADAAGNDHENLNDEYIAFTNTGNEPIDVTEWTVRDEAGHTYQFPAGVTLDPGATVTLHTGSGTDTETELYWGSQRAIWNNEGDTIIVADANGTVVIDTEYP